MPHREYFTALVRLRTAMWEMEVDLGLTRLSQNERDVLYAFHALTSASEPIVTSESARNAQYVATMPHATFHRCLSKLLELGYLERAPNAKTKLYKVAYKKLSL